MIPLLLADLRFHNQSRLVIKSGVLGDGPSSAGPSPGKKSAPMVVVVVTAAIPVMVAMVVVIKPVVPMMMAPASFCTACHGNERQG